MLPPFTILAVIQVQRAVGFLKIKHSAIQPIALRRLALYNVHYGRTKVYVERTL
ncbi:hypothetical protein MALU111345_08465 [Marinicrinis lubricantis]